MTDAMATTSFVKRIDSVNNPFTFLLKCSKIDTFTDFPQLRENRQVFGLPSFEMVHVVKLEFCGRTLLRADTLEKKNC